MTILRANNRSIELSHEEKLYFPEDGITKRNLIDYYAHIAPLFLPYVRHRLLTMQRFPGGIHGEAFYQKNAPDYFPPWILTKWITKKTGRDSDNYVVCNDKATLIYLVNQACITPHVWLSRADKLNYPNSIIWDLDPPHGRPVDFSLVVRVAFMVRDVVSELGLEPFVMTTGSRGVHVRVPIKPEYTFDTVRTFARTVAHSIVDADPDHITVEARNVKRGERLLIDIMRNGYGATAVPPYAVRALPTAPVAMPLMWEELTRRGMHAQKYTIMNLNTRLTEQGDLWKYMQRSQRSLKQALTRLKISVW